MIWFGTPKNDVLVKKLPWQRTAERDNNKSVDGIKKSTYYNGSEIAIVNQNVGVVVIINQSVGQAHSHNSTDEGRVWKDIVFFYV